MDIWAWLEAWRREARESQNEAKLELDATFRRAMDLKDSDPDMAADLFGANAEAARKMGELWIAMLNEHWRLQSILVYKGDYERGRPLAVRAALEVRKPIYDGFPQRACIHDDLLGCFVYVDPHGYAEKIRETLDYMETAIAPGASCRYCFLGQSSSFAGSMGDPAEAMRIVLQGLAEVQSARPHVADHHACNAYSHLCLLALQALPEYQRTPGETNAFAILELKVSNLLEWSKLGLNLASKLKRKQLAVGLLMWSAVGHRLRVEKLGEEAEAMFDHRQLYEISRRHAKLLSVEPGGNFYAAWRTYHSRFGEWEGALEALEAQLARLQGTGNKWSEATCLRDRCQLLNKLGRLTAEDLARAETAARRLLKPEIILDELPSLEA